VNIVIIGSGESGVGAALLAHKLGHSVIVSDAGKIADKYKTKLNDKKISFEEGGHSKELLSNVDLVVKSPGVPEVSEIMTKIRHQGIKVISEIEFAAIHYDGTILAITGSNGKTTTSGLLYHLLQSAGLDVMLGGNYGDSFAGILVDHNPKYMVLEVSSFQLDDIEKFKPQIAILLNITPDHLDRYEYKMENYVSSKFKINANQDGLDHFIVNNDDQEMNAYRKNHSLNGQVIEITRGDFIDGVKSLSGETFDLTVKGEHNLFNTRCAVEACRLLKISEEKIANGLRSFVNLPHRLESFVKIDGVEYVNDSKATNVDSVYYALGAMTAPVIWIAGGTDKGNDYSPLYELAEQKVKALICMGVDNEKLKSTFEGRVDNIVDTHTLAEAVKASMQYASQGDVVLLSPACASFDLFKNYIDRGDKFKAEVMSYLKC
jgi:UDP-N-acetylmuramoylalanine--D-glutamate ligase